MRGSGTEPGVIPLAVGDLFNAIHEVLVSMRPKIPTLKDYQTALKVFFVSHASFTHETGFFF